ncbi:MAG: response regulator [Elusimicrobia bacterium]|nr:response regulator [Elusimicrobiota bacterium]
MFPKKKILAVDDEASACEMYEDSLPVLGYDITCVTSAKKAKEHLLKNVPDLILMDIMMPDQDGISLTKEIHTNTQTAHIPIITVSALSDAATLNDALLFGAVDYLVKPFEMETLKLKIERALTLAERRKTTVAAKKA